MARRSRSRRGTGPSWPSNAWSWARPPIAAIELQLKRVREERRKAMIVMRQTKSELAELTALRAKWESV